MSKLIQLFRDGYEIREIAQELELTRDEVFKQLREYRTSCKKKRRSNYSNSFTEIIVDRFCAGYSSYSIAKDFNMHVSVVAAILKRAGIKLNKGNSRIKPYVVIEWTSSDKCPECHAINFVRKLSVFHSDSKVERNHSFCTHCNVEWYQEDGETRKVLWEMIE